MRAIADASLFLNTSDSSLYSNNSKTQDTTATTKTTTAKTTTDTKTDATNTEIPRETYGLDTLKQMTDVEYEAFQRATATMSPNEKIQAAQSLHLVAKSYQEAQKMMSGGGMVEALNGNSNGLFKSDAAILDNGIKVLSQMSNGDGRTMANFLGRYKGALSSGGINLSA
jgi:hypothetical protein